MTSQTIITWVREAYKAAITVIDAYGLKCPVCIMYIAELLFFDWTFCLMEELWYYFTNMLEYHIPNTKLNRYFFKIELERTIYLFLLISNCIVKNSDSNENLIYKFQVEYLVVVSTVLYLSGANQYNLPPAYWER